jgi:hypothetical protein
MEGNDLPLQYLGQVLERGLQAAFHFPVLEDGAKHIAGLASMDLTIMKFVLALFASVPFGALNRALPWASLRHLWASVGGIFLMYFIFGTRAVRAECVVNCVQHLSR